MPCVSGVYFLISHVLGSRRGAAVGIIYVFGQAIGNALCATGFGESISGLIAGLIIFFIDNFHIIIFTTNSREKNGRWTVGKCTLGLSKKALYVVGETDTNCEVKSPFCILVTTSP